ncbi:AAA family ATPase [Leisingera sp. JC11]|uniref:AAA family ATPase n=1 Tax=Leisingera sp. JC11 TaxID=3042469 RepID=UPI003452080E
MKTAIYLTGLPASGKAALGQALARQLNWPCLERDDFLDALSVRAGAASPEQRIQLGRECDRLFQTAAGALSHCVLVAQWQPRTAAAGRGTPSDWLQQFDTLVEVHCDCSVEVAAERFCARERRLDDPDSLQNRADVLGWMRELETGFPLQAGRLISVLCGPGFDAQKLSRTLAMEIAEI